jgi:putative iron-only hydrogenase system regulator
VHLFRVRILFLEDIKVENRIAIVSIIVEELESAAKVNSILHDYAEFIVGRMGLPYRERKINIICVVIDAPHDNISALSGKIGRISGVSTKTVYSQ